MLRSMILAIVPKAYEQELLNKPECTRNYLGIMAWCRQKTQILRTRKLSDFTRRPTGSSSRVTSLAATPNDHSNVAQGDSLPQLNPLPAPSWPLGILAAVSKPGTQPPPAKHKVDRPPRPAGSSQQGSSRLQVRWLLALHEFRSHSQWRLRQQGQEVPRVRRAAEEGTPRHR